MAAGSGFALESAARYLELLSAFLSPVGPCSRLTVSTARCLELLSALLSLAAACRRDTVYACDYIIYATELIVIHKYSSTLSVFLFLGAILVLFSTEQ